MAFHKVRASKNDACLWDARMVAANDQRTSKVLGDLDIIRVSPRHYRGPPKHTKAIIQSRSQSTVSPYMVTDAKDPQS
jgi:hypothetical protein